MLKPSGGPRPTEADLLQLLGKHPVLRRLPETELVGLLRRATTQDYAERTRIFDQGDSGRTVMAVVDGYVKMATSTEAGREVILEVAGPGAVFGELAVLNGWTRAAEAEALSACRLLVIDGAEFVRTLLRQPDAMLEVLRIISERLRAVTELVIDGVDLPAPARLAKALFRLAALHSHPVPGGLRIDLMLSQRELGGMTGLTRESINKHLSGWRDSGWVQLDERAIVLSDLSALRGLLRPSSWD